MCVLHPACCVLRAACVRMRVPPGWLPHQDGGRDCVHACGLRAVACVLIPCVLAFLVPSCCPTWRVAGLTTELVVEAQNKATSVMSTWRVAGTGAGRAPHRVCKIAVVSPPGGWRDSPQSVIAAKNKATTVMSAWRVAGTGAGRAPHRVCKLRANVEGGRDSASPGMCSAGMCARSLVVAQPG